MITLESYVAMRGKLYLIFVNEQFESSTTVEWLDKDSIVVVVAADFSSSSSFSCTAKLFFHAVVMNINPVEEERLVHEQRSKRIPSDG